MFKRYLIKQICWGILISSALCLNTGIIVAKDDNMIGWQKNSAYNRHYNATEIDDFKGTVIAIKEVVPMPGMSPGIVLMVRERDGESIEVHLCPSGYINRRDIRFKRKDKVKVKGVWAEIDGRDVFMASKVKKGGYTLKIRLTNDGTPFWTMSPEQLAREKATP